MKNEYRVVVFSRWSFFRYTPAIQKEKERTSQKERLLSLLLPYGIGGGHSFNR